MDTSYIQPLVSAVGEVVSFVSSKIPAMTQTAEKTKALEFILVSESSDKTEKPKKENIYDAILSAGGEYERHLDVFLKEKEKADKAASQWAGLQSAIKNKSQEITNLEEEKTAVEVTIKVNSCTSEALTQSTLVTKMKTREKLPELLDQKSNLEKQITLKQKEHYDLQAQETALYLTLTTYKESLDKLEKFSKKVEDDVTEKKKKYEEMAKIFKSSTENFS